MSKQKCFTVSIKLYGDDGRKLEHTEIKLPSNLSAGDAYYIFQRLCEIGTKAGKSQGEFLKRFEK